MKDFLKQYAVVLSSTIELVVTIVVFIFVGQWIDKSYSTGQKGLIIGAVGGAVIAFVRYVMRLQKMNNDS